MGGEGEEKATKAEDWGWTGELDATTITKIAPVSLELWRRGSQWINRRVESIELLDVATLRIHSSIDFRIPTKLPGSMMLGGRGTYFLPLAVLQRRVNQAYFDVRDEAGAALPMLTREENARLASAMLLTAANRALSEAEVEGDLSQNLQAYLATIPTRGVSEGRLFVEAVLDPRNTVVYPQPELAAVLLGDRDFRDLLGLCASSSFIHVPIPAEPGERRIVKLSLLSPWTDPPGSATGQGTSELLRRASVWLGTAPEVAYYGIPQIGNSESFHIQISAPERVEFTSAGIVHTPSAEMTEAQATHAPLYADIEREPGDPATPEKVVVEGVGKRKHIYLKRAHAQRSGWLWVSIRIVRHGYLRASVALAWLTTFLLALFTIRAENILSEEQTAAAVLLLVPVLIAGFLVSPGEHALTRRLLRGPRLLTAVVGGLALIAIAALLTLPAAETDPEVPACLYWIWGIEGAVSLVISIVLTVALRAAGSPSSADDDPPAAIDPEAEGPSPATGEDDGNL